MILNRNLLKEMGYKAPSQSISVIPKQDIINIYNHTIDVILPFLFEFIKSKNIQIDDDQDLIDALYQYKYEINNEYEQKKLHFEINKSYILPHARNTLNHLTTLNVIADNNIESTIQFCTDDFIFDSPDETPDEGIDGQSISVILGDQDNKLYSYVYINLQLYLLKKLYDNYYMLGDIAIRNNINKDSSLRARLLTTIRHELEHQYQSLNTSLILANNFILKELDKKKNINDIIVELQDDWSDITHDENIKDSGYFIKKKSDMSLYKGLDDKDMSTVSIEDDELRLYKYNPAEFSNQLNDFVISYVDVAKNYLNDANEAIDILFEIKDLGKEFFESKNDKSIENDIIKKLYFLFIKRGLDKDDAYEFAENLIQYIEIVNNLQMIQELFYLKFDPSRVKDYNEKSKRLEKSKSRNITILKSKIHKEWKNPYL
jgi:hypothetical protein